MRTATRFDFTKGVTKIKCNDPRHGWTVVVEIVQHDRVFFHKPGGGRWISVRMDRIFLDGKERHTGYSLVRT